MCLTCPNCALDFDRNPGTFIGAIGLNTMVSFGAIVVAIAVGFGVTTEPRSVVSVLLAPLLVGALVPVAFFPFSKTLWVATELVVDPPDA